MTPQMTPTKLSASPKVYHTRKARSAACVEQRPPLSKGWLSHSISVLIFGHMADPLTYLLTIEGKVKKVGRTVH
jgi:hypothetical protein